MDLNLAFESGVIELRVNSLNIIVVGMEPVSKTRIRTRMPLIHVKIEHVKDQEVAERERERGRERERKRERERERRNSETIYLLCLYARTHRAAFSCCVLQSLEPKE